MAKKKKVAKPAQKKPVPAKTSTFSFTKANYWTLFIGLVVIVIGYITLRRGSITLAPILLVLGYCVIIPIGILLRPKQELKAQK
jgi:uncharacterized membrane protein HdeD (DUF308 family)